MTEVFFVNRKTIPWPPEPLRNLTIKAILGYMHWEDRIYLGSTQPIQKRIFR